ncbi:toxin-antitoxin system TumE family protein [Chelativorans alearense]|uniref:toxin-antitoxin system TumE family protein n=1 Tax=Chelativorans alearense TaxID=2681495 RepID=UPI0013D3F114|nr:DUF6516 family protein [Chelativorans alearense]
MRAKPVVNRRLVMSDASFIEMVAWKVPTPLRGSRHDYKYRFAYVVEGACILRYDNEAGKGDHRHIGAQELPYTFTSFDRLVKDFLDDVERLKT